MDKTTESDLILFSRKLQESENLPDSFMYKEELINMWKIEVLKEKASIHDQGIKLKNGKV